MDKFTKEEIENLMEAIKRGVEVLALNPSLERLDGKGWSIYNVGSVIRIDIKR